MMPVNITCPDEPVLHKFALGQMPPEEVEACAEHISACEHCIQSLSRLKVNDTLVDALASQSTVKDRSEKSAVPALLERLKKFGQAAAKAAVEAGENTTTVDADSIPAEDATQPVHADAYDFLAPAQEPDEIGRLGPYRVLGVLGKGGMGVVFEAEDTHLKRRVALKVMKPSLAASETARQRFQLEAQHMASVRDDHIVTIYQVGEDRQIPFLAMECLEGQTLDDLLKRKGELSTAQVLRIGIQTACGLAAAHEKGLIHRDIKPGNIWLEPVRGGRVKILDFGLARAADSDVHITQSGAVVGTPAYMSPEQAQGQEIDLRSDLFSLGSVLYRMATGQLPFGKRSNTTGMLLALAMETPPQPREINPAIPQELNDLIVQLLAKDPAQRPDSARHVIAELQKIEKAIQPKPETSQTASAALVVQPSALPRRMRLRPVVLVAALLLLIGGSLLIPQIIIRLRDKNGKVISETKVPAGVKVKIEKDGKVVKIRGKKKPVVAEDADLDRRAAEWVLSVGGKVGVKVGVNGQKQIVTDKGALPKSFTLTSVSLDATSKADDVGLLHLKDLKNLSFLSINATSVTDKGLVNLKDLKSLSALALYGSKISDAGLVHLKGLQNLTWLGITFTRVSDSGLVNLKDMRHLSYLSLNGSPVSGDGLKHVKEMKNLTHVDLNGTLVSDAGLVHLKDIKNLSIIYLGSTQVTDAGLLHLKDLKSLTQLHLSNTRVTDAGLAHLKDLTNLSGPSLYYGLDLSYTRVTDAGLAHLKDLKKVISLNLSNTRVSDAGLAYLKGSKSLLTLGINQTQIRGPGLAHFKELQNLHLVDTPIDDAGLIHLREMKKLYSLDLHRTQVTDAGLVHLKELEKLSILRVNHTRVSDAGMVHLQDMKSLSNLTLSGTQVTDAGLMELKQSKNLSYLDLSSTRVTDAGLLDFVLSRTSLASLHLSGTRVSAEGVELVRKTFPEANVWWSEPNHNAAVAVLKLGGAVHVGARKNGPIRIVRDLADLPKEYFQVRRVDLAAAKAPLGPAFHLLAQLTDPEFDRLESLDLSGSTLAGNLGILKPLAGLTLSLEKTQTAAHNLDELSGLTGLRVLSLQDTPVNDLGLPYIAKLTGLKRLNLNGTQIKGSRLGELNKLEDLTTISLGCKGINDLTIKHVAKLKKVQNLSLAGSAITDAGLKFLHTMTNLKELDLRETRVTAAGVTALQKAMPKCKIVRDSKE